MKTGERDNNERETETATSATTSMEITVGIDGNESHRQETERKGQVHWLNDARQAFTAA